MHDVEDAASGEQEAVDCASDGSWWRPLARLAASDGDDPSQALAKAAALGVGGLGMAWAVVLTLRETAYDRWRADRAAIAACLWLLGAAAAALVVRNKRCSLRNLLALAVGCATLATAADTVHNGRLDDWVLSLPLLIALRALEAAIFDAQVTERRRFRQPTPANKAGHASPSAVEACEDETLLFFKEVTVPILVVALAGFVSWKSIDESIGHTAYGAAETTPKELFSHILCVRLVAVFGAHAGVSFLSGLLHKHETVAARLSDGLRELSGCMARFDVERAAAVVKDLEGIPEHPALSAIVSYLAAYRVYIPYALLKGPDAYREASPAASPRGHPPQAYVEPSFSLGPLSRGSHVSFGPEVNLQQPKSHSPTSGVWRTLEQLEQQRASSLRRASSIRRSSSLAIEGVPQMVGCRMLASRKRAVLCVALEEVIDELPEEAVAAAAREFLSRAFECILPHGTVHGFDANYVVGSFTRCPDGCRAALAVRARLATFARGFAQANPQHGVMGISVAFGTTYTGSIGTSNHLSFTCFGPAVSEAKRLAATSAAMHTLPKPSPSPKSGDPAGGRRQRSPRSIGLRASHSTGTLRATFAAVDSYFGAVSEPAAVVCTQQVHIRSESELVFRRLPPATPLWPPRAPTPPPAKLARNLSQPELPPDAPTPSSSCQSLAAELPMLSFLYVLEDTLGPPTFPVSPSPSRFRSSSFCRTPTDPSGSWKPLHPADTPLRVHRSDRILKGSPRPPHDAGEPKAQLHNPTEPGDEHRASILNLIDESSPQLQQQQQQQQQQQGRLRAAPAEAARAARVRNPLTVPGDAAGGAPGGRGPRMGTPPTVVLEVASASSGTEELSEKSCEAAEQRPAEPPEPPCISHAELQKKLAMFVGRLRRCQTGLSEVRTLKEGSLKTLVVDFTSARGRIADRVVEEIRNGWQPPSTASRNDPSASLVSETLGSTCEDP